MKKLVCNMCGEDMDEYDVQQRFKYYSIPGYGSEFDSHKVELDLCSKCMDELFKKCKINPVGEGLYN